MPTYRYLCEECGQGKEASKPMSQSGQLERCACGSHMRRDYKSELGRTCGESADWVTISLGTAPAENPRAFEQKYSQFGVKVLDHASGAVSVPARYREAYCNARGRTTDTDSRNRIS